jgi:hypothetical protein
MGSPATRAVGVVAAAAKADIGVMTAMEAGDHKVIPRKKALGARGQVTFYRACGKARHWTKDCKSKAKKMGQAHLAEEEEGCLVLVEASESSMVPRSPSFKFTPQMADLQRLHQCCETPSISWRREYLCSLLMMICKSAPLGGWWISVRQTT